MNPPKLKAMHVTTWTQQICETTKSSGAEIFCEKALYLDAVV
jgi:hypothetical protein